MIKDDGRFVVVDSSREVYWQAATSTDATGGDGGGGGVYRLVFRNNSTLSLLNEVGAELWTAATSTSDNGEYLVLENDGNLVMYDRRGRSVWSTNTQFSKHIFI